jgi:hypothetical protein
MCEQPNTIRIRDEYFRIEEVIQALQHAIAPMRECTVQKVLEAVAPEYVVIAYRK